MNLRGNKYVRFDDSSSVTSPSQTTHTHFRIKKPNLHSFLEGISRGFDMVSERIKCFTRRKPNSSSNKKILGPQEPSLQRWNKIFVISCVIAVSLDPLFFYIPLIDEEKMCLSLDTNLEIIACVLRSLTDFLYVFHIVLQFRTGFIAPSSRVFGRGELVEDPKVIARRYLKSYFIIDVLSVLPLPQAVILVVIPSVNAPIALVTKELLKIVIFSQYLPRLWRIYPLYKKVTRTSGIFTETAWAGAAFNLFLYMLCSNVIGAFWYLFAVERKDGCWRDACHRHHCNSNNLYCGGVTHGDTSFLKSACLPLEPNEIKSPADFDYGIFLDAHQSHVVEHTQFLKFCYCFGGG